MTFLLFAIVISKPETRASRLAPRAFCCIHWSVAKISLPDFCLQPLTRREDKKRLDIFFLSRVDA